MVLLLHSGFLVKTTLYFILKEKSLRGAISGFTEAGKIKNIFAYDYNLNRIKQ
jgi:hypothetical protein